MSARGGVLTGQRVLYDLELQEQWHPIFRGLQYSKSVESYWGMPFYVPKRLSPPLVPSVAALIVKLLHDRIQFSYVKWRESRGLGTIFDDSLTPVLTEGLYLAQEKREQKHSEKNSRLGGSGGGGGRGGGGGGLEERLFAYEQKLDRSAPEGFHISRTLTLNYKFFDPVRVCRELLGQESLHTSGRTSRYGLACLLIPYHNFSCSLWVGLAQLHGND